MKLLAIWIYFCSFMVCLGWVLSPFHFLTESAYILFTGGFIIGSAALSNRDGKFICSRIVIKNIKRYFSWRFPLPALFCLSSTLMFLKGIHAPPCHDDGLCYRIPRVMQWIMNHGWNWAQVEDVRLNTRGTTSEWLTVPILLFTHSDRLIFLPNFICQLFLPGLTFSVWRSLGINSRLSILAMWLLPSSFCFALQSVNSSNDSLGAFFIMAAFYFGFKAKKMSSCWSPVALSILSMALASNVKLNYIPLSLPWFVLIGSSLKILFEFPIKTIGLALLTVGSSFCPESIMDWMHGAGFSGLGLDYRYALQSSVLVSVVSPPPMAGLICNTFLILTQNLISPGVFAMQSVNHFINYVNQSEIGYMLNTYFMNPAFVFYPHIAVEQAGLGFPVCASLVLIYLLSQRSFNVKSAGLKTLISNQNMIFYGILAAFFQFILFSNSNQPARLVMVYYLLLLPLFFSGRSFSYYFFWRLGRFLTLFTIFMSTALMLFLSESPLYSLFDSLNYREYLEVKEQEQLGAVIPLQEQKIAVIRNWGDREAWLWRPYGSRIIMEFPLNPRRADLKAEGIHYIVISEKMLRENKTSLKNWLVKNQATFVVKMGEGYYYTWYAVKVVE